MNTNCISYIVDSTLNAMEVKDKAFHKLLIKMTWANESGIDTTLSDDFNQAGFMMISRKYFHDLVETYILGHRRIKEAIENTCLVNFRTDDFDDLYEALHYNIAFQVAITYASYHTRFTEAPDISLKDAATYYLKFWRIENPTDEKIEDAKETYKSLF